MFGAILKTTNSSFQKGMTFCRCLYVKKVMKLLAFIFVQSSYKPRLDSVVVVVDFLFIVTPIVGVCNCSMFCCTLLYVHSSIAIILMGKRELVVLLNLYSWCLVMVERLFLAVSWGCLRFVIVVFPDHTHLRFLQPGMQTVA